MGVSSLYRHILALILVELLKFSSPAFTAHSRNETGHIIGAELCRDISALAEIINPWVSASSHSAQDPLFFSELLDMSFVEMHMIADFSSDEIMSLVDRIIPEIRTIAPDSELLKYWQILPKGAFANLEATILTIVANCCNEPAIEKWDHAETTLPDSTISDEMPKYTIPDAYNVYRNRTWMISPISRRAL